MDKPICEPLSEMRGPVRALFTDLDGTLTTSGRLRASTFGALEKLTTSGVSVVLVTGRSSGWAQALFSLGPFAAVIAENGGISFCASEAGTSTHYGLPESSLPQWRSKMQAAADHVMEQLPSLQMSSDSRYRVVDLALDWNEEIQAPASDGDRAVDLLRAKGLAASRSSVHVNFAPPLFDKFSATEQLIEGALHRAGISLETSVFVGDALNDAPMFRGFSRSVGVANVAEWWDQLDHRPRYLADAAEGSGLEQVAEHILNTQTS